MGLLVVSQYIQSLDANFPRLRVVSIPAVRKPPALAMTIGNGCGLKEGGVPLPASVPASSTVVELEHPKQRSLRSVQKSSPASPLLTPVEVLYT
jgi:hypothetical protein